MSFYGGAEPGKLAQLGISNEYSMQAVNFRLSMMATTSGLTKYLWNLPPHLASLPVEPYVDPMVVDRTVTHVGLTEDEKGLEAKVRDKNAIGPLRRGRIYWYSRVDTEYMNSTSVNPNNGKDPRFGLHFLWNPNQVTTSVAVNLDITPTAQDKFVKVVGAFPSGEYLTLAIRLDRTNDFFALKALQNDQQMGGRAAAEAMARYYVGGSLEQGFADNVVNKILELQKYGTLADIEYLYKAINGPGWTNAASGRETSDTGFLSPTLLKIELGPFEYIGYVQNLTINHTDFTRSMIPIRSDVNIQFNLMATAGLSTTATPNLGLGSTPIKKPPHGALPVNGL